MLGPLRAGNALDPETSGRSRRRGFPKLAWFDILTKYLQPVLVRQPRC